MLRFSHQPLVFKAEGFLRQQLKRVENRTHRGDCSLAMKSILVSIVAAVFLVGCGQSDHQHSHDDDHSHAEGDHHHIEGDSDGHDKDSDTKPVEETGQPK